MNAMLKPCAWRVISIIAFIFTVSALVQAQPRIKVLDIYRNVNAPETVSLQIIDIRVAGKPIVLGEPFAADDETWLKSLTFRVKNISGKTINSMYVGLGFGFPEFGKDGRNDVAISLLSGIYGKGYDNRVSSEKGKPILPGEEIDLAFTETQLSIIRQMMASSGMTAVDRIKFMPFTFVTFADNSRVRSGFSYPK
jgi:hypothetical protein